MDLSKLPDSQRQELERLQKQFQEHQHKQLQQQPTPYDPFHLHQSYDPSHAYNHPYYYNNNYQDPSQQQQYDPSYDQNYYSNSYQHQHYTQSETSNEQQRNVESGSGVPGLGQVQDPHVNSGNQVNLGGAQPNVGYPGPPGINPAAAAAAVAALSQLIGAPMAGGEHLDHGRFRPPVGHTHYRGGGRRGGGPFRGGGGGNSGFRPPNTGISGAPFRGRGRRVRGKGGRQDPPSVTASSSQPESSAQATAQPPVHIAWCELCGVECTSNELLDQHINGKRHKKNLLRSQRKRGAHQPVVQTEKDAKTSSDIGPEVHENIPENKPNQQTEVGDDNNKVETGENDNLGNKHQRKRKMRGRIRGGRGGGKRMRPTGPRNPKVVIPLVCDLCNIVCDTQEVFDRHAAGKKHLSKLKRFEGHQAIYGPTAVQALYPPNPLSQSLAPQPAYYGAPCSYPEAYIPPPYQAQNPNPQLADAPLEFGTQNSATHADSGVQ